jgi:hypothetical protein
LSHFEPRRLPFYLTFASVIAVLCSNSASNCLIGAALGALLVCHFRFGDALRFPPVKLPLGLFFLATLISVALSGHIREGWPGPRKFYLCLVLLLITSTFRMLSEVRALVIACTGMMTLSALLSLEQFWRKMQEAHALREDFRAYYTVSRITGFTSHWMTLSGEEMIVLMLLCALLFFAGGGRLTGWLAAAGVVIATAFVAAYTRSMWMGAALGGGYLVWLRNRWWLLVAPVPVALLLWLNPMGVGDRLVSVYRPAGDLDSNQFRGVCRRAGWEMIKAHPWFGLGPEQVKAQFLQYIPADVPRPLPRGAYMHLHNTCNTRRNAECRRWSSTWVSGQDVVGLRARRAPHAGGGARAPVRVAWGAGGDDCGDERGVVRAQSQRWRDPHHVPGGLRVRVYGGSGGGRDGVEGLTVSGSRRRFGPRAHRAFNVFLFRLPGQAKVVFELEAQPEFGRGAEVSRQPQCRISRYSAPAAHNIVEPGSGDAQGLGEPVHAHAEWLQDVFLDRFSRVGRRYQLRHGVLS